MHAAGTNRRQQSRGIVGEQKDGGKLGWLFQDFQQRVCRLLHEVSVAEDVDAFPAFHRLVVDLVDDMAHLIDLHQHLRRVGRDDQHVRMGLHEEAGLALVGLAQVLPRLDCLGKALFQRVGFGDADAVGAPSAEIRQAVTERPLQTVHRFRNHLTERKFARALRAGKNHGMGKVIVREHLPQGVHCFFVAMKIREGHSVLIS